MTVVVASGGKLPAKVLASARGELHVVIVVPTRRLRDADLRRLELEYANPGGRVRMRGRVTQDHGGREGVELHIAAPELIEVIQERKHVRVAAECPILMRQLEGGDEVVSHTLDISAGGFLLAPAEELAKGDELEFELGITPGTPPLVGRVEVVRMDAAERVGVAFTLISPADRWRLIRFTLDCQSVEPFRHPDLDAPPSVGED